MINWKCKPYVPTEEQYISWCTDYKSYLDNKSNNPHTNTENTNDNITSTSTDAHTDNEKMMVYYTQIYIYNSEHYSRMCFK